jgi:hypothetical protein
MPAAVYSGAGDMDVFFDANEVVPGSTLDLLLRELREAREARDTTNRCGYDSYNVRPSVVRHA